MFCKKLTAFLMVMFLGLAVSFEATAEKAFSDLSSERQSALLVNMGIRSFSDVCSKCNAKEAEGGNSNGAHITLPDGTAFFTPPSVLKEIGEKLLNSQYGKFLAKIDRGDINPSKEKILSVLKKMSLEFALLAREKTIRASVEGR